MHITTVACGRQRQRRDALFEKHAKLLQRCIREGRGIGALRDPPYIALACLAGHRLTRHASDGQWICDVCGHGIPRGSRCTQYRVTG